jgi:hypothetical protein
VKERPILFSGPMVRAILEGRKTQTRRVVKPQPPHSCAYIINGKQNAACCYLAKPPPVNRPTVWVPPTPKSKTHLLICPYGQPGDRLWVRESHYMSLLTHDGGAGVVEYRADYCDELASGIRWSPSIHMPRWASRITLEVVSVRVERLHEISKEDAMAEGVVENDLGRLASETLHTYKSQRVSPVVLQYADLWESINGPESWAENPWVWVVEFKRVEGGGQ